ncbi:MAG TPA: energy transducer TonB [Steroidobacteraceae bacterium]|nr:energy transducer TonB [Steroidobacteraceae bacterium]
MFGFDLPRAGLLIVVGVIHVAVAVAFAQITRTERVNKPVLVMETLFLSTHEPEEVPPPPTVTVEPIALRVNTSAPLLNIEMTAMSDAPPSPNAPTAIVSSSPSFNTTSPVEVENVQYVEAPRPRYPALSRRLKEQGVVVLKVLVDERGAAQQIEVADSSGHERLDQAAVEAVAAATFRPFLENGVPRAMLVLIPIEFGLHRARS